MANSLEGRVALITGSGGGMGRSHAVLMAERGADIIVHDIKEDGANETAEMVRSFGRTASELIADSRDIPTFTAKIAEAEAAHGKIDILINNAGVSGNKLPVEGVDEAAFDLMFDVQVKGAFFATQAVLPGMKARKFGRIIMISSIYAMGGSFFASHYSGAKAALSGFTKAWAREFAAWKITVNAVAPGYIGTEMVLAVPEKILNEVIIPAIPAGRLGKVEEIARCVTFLASDDAGFITGSTLTANGGQYMA